MISVFDTHPVTFEGKKRTLTISYNGVLCKDANGTVTTDIDFDVNRPLNVRPKILTLRRSVFLWQNIALYLN